MKAYIKGISSYVPSHIEYNDVDSRITKKTGIYERHIAAPEECSSDMAVCAAENLFSEYGIDCVFRQHPDTHFGSIRTA